jgi:hypothetical protein
VRRTLAEVKQKLEEALHLSKQRNIKGNHGKTTPRHHR